nr:MAG TPA: hypothetical protein [Caudoviricetes sp.]
MNDTKKITLIGVDYKDTAFKFGMDYLYGLKIVVINSITNHAYDVEISHPSFMEMSIAHKGVNDIFRDCQIENYDVASFMDDLDLMRRNGHDYNKDGIPVIVMMGYTKNNLRNYFRFEATIMMASTVHIQLKGNQLYAYKVDTHFNINDYPVFYNMIQKMENN